MVVVRIFLLLSALCEVQSNLVTQKIFHKSSCTLTFLDDVRWFGTSPGPAEDRILVSGDNFISSVGGCHVIQNQVLEGVVSPLLKMSQEQVLFCLEGELYHTNPNLTHATAVLPQNDLYTMSSICQQAPVQKVVYKKLGDVVYSASEHARRYPARFSKLDATSGWTLQASEADMLDIRKIVAIFQNRHFVYIVYTNTAEEGVIARVCANDTGSYGNFKTYRYGVVSCTTAEVSHKVLLSASYDPLTSSLLLLTSRPPVDLSARLLCRLSLEEVDEMLDTGLFLDYDELGSPTRTPGTPTQCKERQETQYLSQLTEIMHSTDVLVKRVADYRLFDVLRLDNQTWFYLADEHSVDVWKEKSSGRSSLHQTIRTRLSISDISLQNREMLLISGATLTRAPAFPCQHVVDPVECYSPRTPFCAWSRDRWACVGRREQRSFVEDYPEGLEKEEIVQGGCVREVTKYTTGGTTTRHEAALCTAPPLSNTTLILLLNTTCGGRVELGCVAGTALVAGDAVRQCLPGGRWTGNPPVCRSKKCGVLYPPPGGTLSSHNNDVGTQVSVRCLEQCQETESDVPLQCLKSGSWNATRLPGCRHKVCPRLPSPVNTLELYSADPPLCGTKVVVECSAGYSLVFGDKVRYCRSDSSWDGSMPFCAVTHCVPLFTPQNSRLSTPSHRVSDTVTVTCNTCHRVQEPGGGFRVSATTQCLNNGKWSNSVTCQEVKCPALQPDSHVRMKLMNNSCIGMAEFECDEGFWLRSGALVRHCQPDGKWSGSQPHCEVVSCPALKLASEHVQVEPPWIRNSGRFREKVMFRCTEDSYLASGSLELICLASGAWSGQFPVCLPFPESNSTTVAPEFMSAEASTQRGGGGVVAVAVAGWTMFLLLLVVVTVGVVLLKKGVIQLPGASSACLFGACLSGACLSRTEQGTTAPAYERQVTQQTTTGSTSNEHG